MVRNIESSRITVMIKVADNLGEGFLSFLVEIGDRDASS